MRAAATVLAAEARVEEGSPRVSGRCVRAGDETARRGWWRWAVAVSGDARVDAVHPLLRGWVEKLEPYRTSVAGLQSYWAEWDAYRAEMFRFLRSWDVILCPAYTHAALPHGKSIEEENFRGFSHTMAYNLTGWPAAVVRCGESSTGLPIAVQVVAHPWREDVALAVAGWLESALGGWRAPRACEELPVGRPLWERRQ